jgi:hypothetical protein
VAILLALPQMSSLGVLIGLFFVCPSLLHQ